MEQSIRFNFEKYTAGEEGKEGRQALERDITAMFEGAVISGCCVPKITHEYVFFPELLDRLYEKVNEYKARTNSPIPAL